MVSADSVTDRTPGSEQDGGIDLFAVLGTLWRRKGLIVLCALIGGLVAAYYATRVAEPTYRATTQMALIFDQSPVVDIESVVTGVSSDVSSLNTEMEIIRSRELISRLVDQLNLTADPDFNTALQPEPRFSLRQVRQRIVDLIWTPEEQAAPTEAAIRNAVIDRTRRMISTDIGRQSYIFSISATTGNPAKAALLTNTLAQIYQDDQIAIKVKGTEAAAVWLSERVSELRTELEKRQSDINARRSESALISPEALAALNTQSVELASQLQAAELELTRATEDLARIETVADQGVAVRAQAADDPQLTSIAVDATSGDAAAVQRFDRRFAQLLQQARSQRDLAQRRIEDLRAQTRRLEDQFNSQADELIKIQQLERETEATRVLYETFLNRLRETSVQVGVQQADSRVLSAAITGTYIAPRKSMITLLGLILGAVAASALVLVREMMQNTFRTAEALEERTGRAVLGQIPEIPATGRAETITYLASKPTSAAAEAVRNLRTSVLMSNVDNPPQVILMTSSIPGEGKTTTSIALAQNLAGLGKRVLLIEGDIRRRTFGAYFPQAVKAPGILSLIGQFGAGKTPDDAVLDGAVHHAAALGIDILMGEKSEINAADVFASKAFRDLMEMARRRYDYILIDTPPVLVVPDARVIGPQADAILYVVNWDRTTQTQVGEGLRQLQIANLQVDGLVLTQIDPRGMKRYGYGYGYGVGGAGYYEV